MGATLAKVVHSATWAHLPPTSRLLFGFMALTALDQDKHPRYFGGRDALVLSMDGHLSEKPDEREGQYRRVRRALEKVKQAGGITPLNTAHTSARAEYELHVLPGEAVTNRPPVALEEAVTNRPPEAVTNRPPLDPSGGHFVTGEAVTNRPPKEYEEQEVPGGLTRGGIDRVSAQPHLGAREGGLQADLWSRKQQQQTCRTCRLPEQRCRELAASTNDHHLFESGAA